MNYNNFIKFFRTRFWIHIAGAFFVADIGLRIMDWIVDYHNLLICMFIPLVIGLISELKDIIYEYNYEDKIWKHIKDIVTWGVAGFVWGLLRIL